MTWFCREKIGRASIKESLDNLPSGICFADQSGLVILSNRQMYRLCYTLMGVDLQHISELLDALEKPQAGIRSVGADTNVRATRSQLKRLRSSQNLIRLKGA